jgi:hypothetical protein
VYLVLPNGRVIFPRFHPGGAWVKLVKWFGAIGCAGMIAMVGDHAPWYFTIAPAATLGLALLSAAWYLVTTANRLDILRDGSS